jgi:glycosyltransferase involved in cell wall biosynthesis
MKITHVITGLNDGGAEAVLYRLCAYDRRHRHTVISLMDDGKYGTRLRGEGVPVHALGMDRGKSGIAALAKLWHLLRVEKPDVVQTWMYHADLLGGVVGRLAGVRAVCWGIRHTNLEPGLSKSRTIRIAQACALLSRWVPKKIVCCAESAAQVHGDLGYSRGKMVVVRNGYDLERFRPDADARQRIRAELGVPREAMLFGMVGRFDPQKDHASLIGALAALRREGQDVYCVLVGRGMDRENSGLEGWLDVAGVADRVVLAGPRSDIPAVMNALDVHVLSSSFGEAFPNVLCEAMACGTPMCYDRRR